MNRRKFLEYLADNNIFVVKHGNEHDIIANASTKTAIPRHRDVSQGVVEQICKKFKINKPKFK